MKHSLVVLYICCLLITTSAAALDESALSPWFGSYRNKSYNGIWNQSSTRFFAPSINVEPSVKLHQANGEPFRTLNFNFEVPFRNSENQLALKFLFAEMPLNGAVLENGPDGKTATLKFNGVIAEHQNGAFVQCEAEYLVTLKREKAKLVRVSFVKTAAAPCTSENHQLLGELAL